MTPELAAVMSGATTALERFRAADEAFVRDPDEMPPPDYAGTCYELASYVNQLLRLIDGSGDAA